MSEALAPAYPRSGRPRVSAGPPAVLALAAQEAQRLLLHPAGLLGLVYYVVSVATFGDEDPGGAFGMTTSQPTLFYGVAMLFAANLVASRDRRAHSGDLVAATPLLPQSRTVALLLAASAPAVLCGAVVLVVHAAYRGYGVYVESPSGWHLLQGPLTVLGAGLLGVMVARWAPFPGAMLLVLVALVAVNLYPANHPERWTGLGIYAAWAVYSEQPGWAGTHPGSLPWHCAYLAGLCAMAAAGALVPEAARRGRVLVVGALLTALTAGAGWVQLP